MYCLYIFPRSYQLVIHAFLRTAVYSVFLGVCERFLQMITFRLHLFLYLLNKSSEVIQNMKRRQTMTVCSVKNWIGYKTIPCYMPDLSLSIYSISLKATLTLYQNYVVKPYFKKKKILVLPMPPNTKPMPWNPNLKSAGETLQGLSTSWVPYSLFPPTHISTSLLYTLSIIPVMCAGQSLLLHWIMFE